MLHATWKSLWARKGRLILSALAIVLGVAFVAGSLVFTAMLAASFDQLLKGSVGDVNVVSGTLIEQQLTGTLLTPDELGRMADIEGVTAATGIVSSYSVFPLDGDGHLMSFPGAPGIATNWHETAAADGQLGPHIVEGRAPAAATEVVIDPATAEKGGYQLGEKVSVATPQDGVVSFTLVGTGTYGGGTTAGASYLFFTLDEMRHIAVDGAAGYTGAWLTTAPTADPESVADQVKSLVAPQFSVQTGRQMADQAREQLDVGLGFVNVFLLTFAGISLLVAMLLIFNTFSILIAQRSHELALLRAMGATRRQVRGAVLLEAAAVGAVGATLGVALGYGLSWVILMGLDAVGIDLGVALPPFSWQAVAAGYAIGIVVTVGAALMPAVRASATRPVEAMGSSTQSGMEKLDTAQFIGVALVELGLAAVVVAVLLPVSAPLVWFGAGAAALVIGVAMSAAILGAPVVWVLGLGYRRAFGEVGVLAHRNAVRQPRRTAATAATLMIGVALVTIVAILASSTTGSLERRLTADQRGDFVVAPIAYQPFDASVRASVTAVPGVADAFAFRRSQAKVSGVPGHVTLGGADSQALARATNLHLVAGGLTAEGQAKPALVSSSFAEDNSIGIGELIDVTGTVGTQQVLVTGIHQDDQTPSLGDVIVEENVFAKISDDALLSRIIVFTAPGADQATVKRDLQEAVAQVPTVAVSDVHEFTQERIDQFSQLFGVIYALLALAVVVSVLGIVNTLGLSVLERTREIGLLRAVGLTRPQTRRLITLESVMVTTLGAILGVVLGLILGAALVHLLADSGIDLLIINWVEILAFVVVAALTGVLAAVVPARRAARLGVLASIAVE